LEWRTYAKLKSTYTTSLLEARDNHNRVHTTFTQTVVNTGRLASSNPNLQNIPNRTEIGRKIRACFEAKKGYKLVAADYSQMELRLMASVAGVKALQEAFASGVDIHAATAARVFGLEPDKVDREHRTRAKAINFGIIYGISQFGLAKQIGVSREMAKQYIDSYFAIMPEVKDFMDKTIEFAHRYGYVETPFGRKCSVLGINDQNHRTSSFAERAAINAPIQGGAADIVKIAMQRINYAFKERKLDARLLLQVHDELVAEVREDLVPEVSALLKQIMEEAADTVVKMEAEVDAGNNWNEAH
jgi:DNA polymerase-1